MEADGPGWSLIYPSKIPPEWDSYAPMENCFWIEFVFICLYPHQIIGVVKASSVKQQKFREIVQQFVIFLE